MPIHLRENQYRGVNAHLQSYLQSPGGGWEMFHAAHITHLTEAIDLLLPEGYYSLNEKSLQLVIFDFEIGEQSASRTRPDIGLYQISPSTSPATSGVPVATLPLIKIVLEDDPLSSTVIVQQREDGQFTLITRIELLSPGNKPPGTHYRQYLRKRNETLDNGINLVEIDYLHETHLPSQLIPSYPHNEPNAYPNIILVSEPNSPLNRGRTSLYGCHVDEPVPLVEIPLTNDETITLNLGEVFHQTFASNRYYGIVIVDYEQLPLHFERYNPPDQERIRARMAAVQAVS